MLYKTPSILIAFCLSASFLFGQKTEVNLNVYSGLFSYYGSASLPAWIGYPDVVVYGRKPGTSYSFELQVQHVTRQKHLFGFGGSYEQLRSKAKLTIPPGATGNGSQGSSGPWMYGKIILDNSVLTLNPFIGHRFFYKAVALDALAGVDLSYNLKTNASDEYENYHYRHVYESHEITPAIDIRPRIQVNANYNHLNLILGYSLGLSNYKQGDYSYPYIGYDGLNTKAYTRFLRVGFGYRIN